MIHRNARFAPGLGMLLMLAPACSAQGAPRHVYLTWQGDTSRTMTVNFQTMAPIDAATVYYADSAAALADPDRRQIAHGTSHQIEGLPDGRWIHWVELAGLEPGGRYHYQAGDEQGGFSEPMQFRTVPDDESPLRFVVGGDSNPNHPGMQVQLYREAAALAPQFVLFGGDLAYANGQFEQIGKWDAWFEQWAEQMVTPEGDQIPIVLAIGNHEVRGYYDGTPEQAPFYYGFFAQSGERAYYTRTFGKLMALVVLDTDHTAPYEGEQTAWLERQLQDHRPYPYRFAMYHVPLYSSGRGFNEGRSPKGREHWAPLFDRFELTAGFEAHDHTYKRTPPIRHGEIVEQGGTVYFGDGCFGQGPRAVDYPYRWYLARAGGLPHFWLVEVEPEGAEYRAINHHGEVFDVYPENAAGAEQARQVFRDMPKGYRFRSPLVSGGAALTERERFDGGPAELLVNNHLPHAIAVSFQAADDHEQLRAAGLPVEPVVVEAERTQPVAVTLEARKSVAADAATPLAVTYTVRHAQSGELLTEKETALHVERVHRVEPVDAAVTVDGRLQEWAELPHRSHRSGHVFVTKAWGGEYEGEEDLSFAFEVAEDAEHLYVAVRVRDDVFVREAIEADQQPNPNRQDSVTVHIDARPRDARRAFELGEGKWGWLQVALSPTDRVEDEPVLFKPEELPEGVRGACVRTDDGFTAEMAIPHAYLNEQQGEAWRSLRLNVMVRDYDEQDLSNPWAYRTELRWRPTWGSKQSYIGSGTLVREPSPDQPGR